jgi:hypothetical protein
VLGEIQKRKVSFAPKSVYIFEDQYRDFLVFEPPSVELLQLIILTVMHYNREANHQGEQQMIFFFERLIIRVCAASRI